MANYQVVKIRDNKNLIETASKWFHSKWGVSQQAYFESMNESIQGNKPVPQWYAVFDQEKIIAGIGVIENDFHNRKDFAPNVCAVYVENEYRKNSIAGMMLNYVCEDFKEMGIGTLYLITDHTAFYERYGWEFLCMVQGDGEPQMTRMYIHQS